MALSKKDTRELHEYLQNLAAQRRQEQELRELGLLPKVNAPPHVIIESANPPNFYDAHPKGGEYGDV